MPLSKGPSSLLEAQNRVLIKTAGERAAQIEKLERELQRLHEMATQADRLEHASCRAFKTSCSVFEKM